MCRDIFLADGKLTAPDFIAGIDVVLPACLITRIRDKIIGIVGHETAAIVGAGEHLIALPDELLPILARQYFKFKATQLRQQKSGGVILMIPYGAVQSVCPTCKNGISIRRNSERYHIPSPTGGAFEFREYVCSLHRHEIIDSHADGLRIFCSGQQRRNFRERLRGRRS